MELDDLQQIWNHADAGLDARLRLRPARVHAAVCGRIETALRRLARWLAIEAAGGLVAALWLGSFLWDHAAQPRFLVPAAALHLANLLLTAFAIRQLVAVRALDLGAPVVALQQRMESLRRERLRVTLAALACGPLLWTAGLVVAFVAVLGVDPYAVLPGRYLLANLLCGLAAVAAAAWVAWRYGDRLAGSTPMQRLLRHLGGHNLRAASAALAALARFEAEDEPAPPRG
jgi:hypothetical protein